MIDSRILETQLFSMHSDTLGSDYWKNVSLIRYTRKGTSLPSRAMNAVMSKHVPSPCFVLYK